MIIREVRASDADVWKAMRCALWPDGTEEHRAEIAAFLAGDAHEPRAVFVAEDESGLLVGVAELSIRNDVAGIAGKRTGYAEGLYVGPSGEDVESRENYCTRRSYGLAKTSARRLQAIAQTE